MFSLLREREGRGWGRETDRDGHPLVASNSRSSTCPDQGLTVQPTEPLWPELYFNFKPVELFFIFIL